jgi:uncharacterized membrane-anchored protein YitT (DUF2179 family)
MKDYLYIIAGAIFLALGVVSFLLPNNIITGGTAGLALILHQISTFTIGSLIILVNVPLLILGFKYFGKQFVIKTIFTIIITSVFIDIFNELIHLQAATHETILATIFGGICIGLGLGFVIKGKASAGGSTIIATIVASKTHYKASEVILLIDALIISLSIYVFNDLEKALWSILSIYVSSRIIDVILSGRPSKKVVYIVTEEVDKLSAQITKKLGPDGTILNGKGLISGQEKTMILIVVKISKIQILKEIINECDPKSFLVITDASELLGRGN